MWWCWRWFWLKQKRCGGGADIKTIKYCGGDGGAMIKQWKCVGGVDSSGKQWKSGGGVRVSAYSSVDKMNQQMNTLFRF